MAFTAERKILAGLGTVLLFNGIVALVFYLSTARCRETSNQILALAEKQLVAQGTLRAMDLQIRQTRWISGGAGLCSVLSVVVASIVVARDFGRRHRGEERIRQDESDSGSLSRVPGNMQLSGSTPAGSSRHGTPGRNEARDTRLRRLSGGIVPAFIRPEEIECGQPDMELKSALEAGQYETDGWRLRKDGSRFWGNVVITPLRDAAGNHIGFSNISRDLTDHNRSRDAISD